MSDVGRGIGLGEELDSTTEHLEGFLIKLISAETGFIRQTHDVFELA